MTENLRLTFQDGKAVHSTTGALTTLTSHNSDLTTFESWDGGGHTTENSSNNTVWYSGNNNTDNIPKSYTHGDNKSSLNYGSTTQDTEQYMGSLYNWFVATAGRGTSTVSDNEIVEDSICPYGWRLPQGIGEKSWYSLLSLAGSTANDGEWAQAVRDVPYSLIHSGGYDGERGVVYAHPGFYWTSQTVGIYPYQVDLLPNYVAPQHRNINGWGMSVRCVSK